MPITFYSAPFSSAAPVATALAELGVPHDVVEFDLSKSDHKQPDYLAINPNGTVPAMVIDGQPMFEALAILLWLGETVGVDQGLWPRSDAPLRLQAYSWCVWTYATYGSALGMLATVSREALPNSADAAAYAKHRLGNLLGVLEERLSLQRYMLGDSFSLVDLVVASAVGYSVLLGAGVSNRPHVRAWLGAFQQRPSYQSTVGASLQASA